MRLLKSPILLFVSALFSIACSNDDSGNSDGNDLVIGAYNLTAVTINPPQDINKNGTASSNLLDELTCISGTLNVNADKSWNLKIRRINVTSITGGVFFIECGDSDTKSGTWIFSNNQLNLNDSTEPTVYTLRENTLTQQIGKDLPNFQNIAFTKM